MTEALDHEPADEPRYLLAHPQRLGFLPTRWFWNDRSNWRLVRVPFAVLMAVLIVAIGVFKPPLYVAGLLPVVVYTVVLGLFERYIRRRASERRLEVESGVPGELPPQT